MGSKRVAVRCGNGKMRRPHLPPQGRSDLDHCAFEPKEDLQNDLLYDVLVQIRSAALQWPEQGLDHNNDDDRELAFALVTNAYAGVSPSCICAASMFELT
ncbi:BZ3500_MvSof-1268-A1-R1_Chr5-3g08303 [Microbotryum saponariae]|uniref:BZ3500_MvSof-1268-A1-R1_Chr5-3g08303 protein n=1 Tax=Microbotryum saponariae TaxID=289078 RepID=A0A2X0LMN7_9BASI|nr:BZ3500_MvSof-1268-A1-R1_Chr5-3g08303 [Microbotryum saponariae]SDA08411.1 BZ3501_MvSof-1269-A2-R1_Chr5-3g08031 [Microbotryum saponariae]